MSLCYSDIQQRSLNISVLCVSMLEPVNIFLQPLTAGSAVGFCLDRAFVLPTIPQAALLSEEHTKCAIAFIE